ncbi:hypothetical protein D3C86_1158650 [compost metagenome]
MTDRDVDVRIQIVGFRNGEERGDRPTLDHIERLIGQAPFDVLRMAEVGLDRSAQALELHDPLIGQRGLVLPLRLDLPRFRAALAPGKQGQGLGGDLLLDHVAIPYLVAVRIDLA